MADPYSPPSLPPPQGPATQRWVVCLCADWCGTCRDYRSVFDEVAAVHAGTPFVWLDIEDQAALVGDLDIETFPMLLIVDGVTLRFAGPLLPHAATLSRLIGSLESAGAALQPLDPALAVLVQTLHRQFSAGQTGPAESP